MKCAECSKQIPDGFADCPWCGATPPSDSSARVQGMFESLTPKTVSLAILSFGFLAMVLWLNYRKALVWAGTITAESAGYMIGGVLFSLLIGYLGLYLTKKMRGENLAPTSKAFVIMGVALLFSIYGLASEIYSSRIQNEDVNHHVGGLFKEAAGKDRASTDENWIDTATRETLHDVLIMNQQYVGEMSTLDRSAMQNLYSADSYAGVAHMQKVVVQVKGSLAVDEKYASINPILKNLEARISAANAPETEKQHYLKGVRLGLQQSLGRRTELIHMEEEWAKSTIDLYQFLIAHTNDYSIQDKKLIIPDSRTRAEFSSLQTNAVSLRKEFLKMKKTMRESRDEKLSQLGLSSSDFTPAQLGKIK
jgi:hypothetical protein